MSPRELVPAVDSRVSQELALDMHTHDQLRYILQRTSSVLGQIAPSSLITQTQRISVPHRDSVQIAGLDQSLPIRAYTVETVLDNLTGDADMRVHLFPNEVGGAIELSTMLDNERDTAETIAQRIFKYRRAGTKGTRRVTGADVFQTLQDLAPRKNIAHLAHPRKAYSSYAAVNAVQAIYTDGRGLSVGGHQQRLAQHVGSEDNFGNDREIRNARDLALLAMANWETIEDMFERPIAPKLQAPVSTFALTKYDRTTYQSLALDASHDVGDYIATKIHYSVQDGNPRSGKVLMTASGDPQKYDLTQISQELAHYHAPEIERIVERTAAIVLNSCGFDPRKVLV